MASLADHGVSSGVEKRSHSNDGSVDIKDEKHDADISVIESQSDLSQQDEALKLVGRERQAEFSDEFNRRLRRKLVSLWSCRLMEEHTLTVLRPGLVDSTPMRRGLLHAILVSGI